VRYNKLGYELSQLVFSFHYYYRELILIIRSLSPFPSISLERKKESKKERKAEERGKKGAKTGNCLTR
jgi:hypothetical protein